MGRKWENPEKKHLAHPQAELGLSHVPYVGLFLSFLSLHNAIRPRGHSRHVALSKKSKYVNRMRLKAKKVTVREKSVIVRG